MRPTRGLKKDLVKEALRRLDLRVRVDGVLVLLLPVLDVAEFLKFKRRHGVVPLLLRELLLQHGFVKYRPYLRR